MRDANFVLITTAGELGVNCLYHYQRFDESWLRQTILERLIYLSNPKNFNDPWDCRPWYQAPDTAKKRKELVTSLVGAHKKYFPGRTRNERRVAQRGLLGTPTLVANEVKKISEGIWHDIAERYRVFCLSTRPDSQLMWAHYAAKHTGICLEFSCENIVFSGALRVQYHSEYPRFELFGGDHIAPFVSKSDQWKYEEEFRLISQEAGAQKNAAETLITRNGLLNIPKSALQTVIIGALATDDTVTSITNLIKESRTPISLRKAVRAPDRYELQFVDQK